MKNKSIIMSVLLLFLSLALQIFPATPSFEKVNWDKSLMDLSINTPAEKEALIESIDNSLIYLKSSKAEEQYKNMNGTPFNLKKVEYSLLRIKEILMKVKNTDELNNYLQKEFDVYEVKNILFTGYYTPAFDGNLTKTNEFKWPVFKRPANLEEIKDKSRKELEGITGLSTSLLKNNEIVYLKNRLDVFLLQIQGSGVISLPDGKTISLGVAATNEKDYTSIGKLLIKDNKIKAENMSLQAIIDYFDKNEKQLDFYLPQNERFIFFSETTGNPVKGSLAVPLVATRSIAMDKALFPSGTIGIIKTKLPNESGNKTDSTRFVIDLDTGGAIKGLRSDLYMGLGNKAKEKAGVVNDEGSIYYLILK